MSTSSSTFSDTVKTTILDLVWRQWVGIGIPGYAQGEEPRVVDPEALTVLTMTVARHDARLFDEVLSWWRHHGDLVNVQRLRNLLAHAPREAEATLGAVAEVLGRKSSSAPKWKQLASLPGLETPAPLFFQHNGRPMPIPATVDDTFARHGLLRPPVPTATAPTPLPRQGAATLLLRLRSLLGVNLRCEILCLLGAHDEIHPSRLAALVNAAPRTVQKLLAEMAASGYVQIRMQAREKFYTLTPGPLDPLLRPEGPTPWRHSVPLFRALEQLWTTDTDGLNPLTASSQWRRLARSIRPLLAEAEPTRLLQDDAVYPGEAYTDVFQADITAILGSL